MGQGLVSPVRNFPWPDRAYLVELFRPWKLVTFGIAMSWLLYGALTYGIADWDVGITLLMGSLTYLCAPWSVYIIVNAGRRRPSAWVLHVFIALVVALFVIDWDYWIYHTVMGNQMYRLENFKVSTAVYFLAGIIWLYRGSVREFLHNVKSLIK